MNDEHFLYHTHQQNNVALKLDKSQLDPDHVRHQMPSTTQRRFSNTRRRRSNTRRRRTRRTSPTKPRGGATRDERAIASEYRQRYWTPKHVYKQLCGIVHADDTRPASPFALPMPDATWAQKASWKG